MAPTTIFLTSRLYTINPHCAKTRGSGRKITKQAMQCYNQNLVFVARNSRKVRQREMVNDSRRKVAKGKRRYTLVFVGTTNHLRLPWKLALGI
jgi:hypothetical protein